jgi:hypothetical protein
MSVTSSFAQSEETAAVKTVFVNYKDAIMKGNGAEAAKYVDTKTIAYYDGLLQKIISADSVEVSKLNVLDKMTLLTVRHKIPKAKVLGTNAKDFFIYIIDQGMVSKNTIANVELGEITINGSTASGQISNNSLQIPIAFEFNKEPSGWKIDITSMFGPTSAALKQFLQATNTSENDFIFRMLTMVSGKAPGNEIWQPLR